MPVDKIRIMGVLNITPNSFYDGGFYANPDMAVSRAYQILNDGADILDIGAESSRPGASDLPAEKETEILNLFFNHFKLPQNTCLSVDTSRSKPASLALKYGAKIINDIYALRRDPSLASLIAGYEDVSVILMHMQGTPATMQQQPVYNHILDDMLNFFEDRVTYALSQGIKEHRILLDPGIGFGKTLDHNLTILKNIHIFKKLGFPLVVGHSRKSFIGSILNLDNPLDRLTGSLAVSSYLCYKQVDVLRVHDVRETQQTRAIFEALKNCPPSDFSLTHCKSNEKAS